MISGANEEELELASARMDIMLATNYTPDNPGPLSIIDKYHDKEIERLKKKLDCDLQWAKKYDELFEEKNRLNNIIDELGKDLWKIRQLTFSKYNSNEWNNCLSFNDDILPIIKRIKALKEGK